jgi:hypothetical protein
VDRLDDRSGLSRADGPAHVVRNAALSPFAWTWFAQDWEPILDVYLLTILAAGLWFGRSPRKAGSVSAPTGRSRNAVLAMGLMMVNYGVRATAHHEAIAQAPQVFGAQLPAPCADVLRPHRSNTGPGRLNRRPPTGHRVVSSRSRRCQTFCRHFAGD